LESVVSAAAARLEHKLEYWGTGGEKVGTVWERPGSLGEESLPQVLASIDLNYLVGKNEWAIVGVGWELLWGVKPPEAVTQRKEKLLAKADAGVALTKIEELWLNLIRVDTDRF
jgi:hypothetical protein